MAWLMDPPHPIKSHNMNPSINLPEVLASHGRWLAGEATGQKANLRSADLSGADLSGANLRGADLSFADLRGADLSGANLSGADLRGANLRGADLSGADLSGANLSGADLRGADLSGADLSGADLSGANLSGANLSFADLRFANLRGADGLIIAGDAPQRLRAVAAAALQEGALEMETWHTCPTTHCIGGTAIHQAGEVGRLLEAAVGPEVAALMLLGVEAYSHFYDSNEEAAKWLQSVLEPAA